jgi:hypothetical protein
MKIERLQQIVYAEGFVEDFIEQYINDIDEETANAKTLEQAQLLQGLWLTLSSGLTELRKENAALQSRLDTARQAIG